MFEHVKYPEELGISSKMLNRYLDDVEKRGLCMHAVTILRHGKVAAQFAWEPYHLDEPHMLFSLSKSFTSCAVGFAVAEGLLTYDTPILDILPDKAPENPSEALRKIKIGDLLCMGSGLAPESDDAHTDDWCREILAHPVLHAPGEVFHYNSHGTYLCSAAVQRVTGQTVRDYLLPRLFEPLEMGVPDWDSCPQGINCGGWGLHLSCENIAKFGQLLLQKGMWQGKRVLPEGWVETATTKKIDNDEGKCQPENEWAQGYGYQFWRARGGRYRGDGAFGQICMIDEARDMVVAATAGVNDMPGEMQAMYDYLFPAADAEPATEAEREAFLARIASLGYAFPTDSGEGALPEGVYEREDGKETLSFESRPDGTLFVMSVEPDDRTECVYGKGQPILTVLPPNKFTSAPQPVLAAWGRADGKLRMTARLTHAPFMYDTTYTVMDDALVAETISVPAANTPARYVKKTDV